MRNLFLPVLLFSFIAGCSASKNESTPPALSYSVTISQGGGFTGAKYVCAIDTSGIVYTYQSLPGNEPQHLLQGKLSIEQIEKLNSLFPSMSDLNYSVNGNMTTSIILDGYGKEKHFSFSGTEPGSDVPEPLKIFHNTLRNILNNIKE